MSTNHNHARCVFFTRSCFLSTRRHPAHQTAHLQHTYSTLTAHLQHTPCPCRFFILLSCVCRGIQWVELTADVVFHSIEHDALCSSLRAGLLPISAISATLWVRYFFVQPTGCKYSYIYRPGIRIDASIHRSRRLHSAQHR